MSEFVKVLVRQFDFNEYPREGYLNVCVECRVCFASQTIVRDIYCTSCEKPFFCVKQAEFCEKWDEKEKQCNEEGPFSHL